MGNLYPTMGLLVMISLMTFVEVSAQSTNNASPSLSQDIVAYIVMGVIMAVIVIIIIVILVISCGRWNWRMRRSNTRSRSTSKIRRNIMIAQTSQKPQKNKKLKLKIGMKENPNLTMAESNVSGNSRALFVMGGNNGTEGSTEVSTVRNSGPHVARVELEGGTSFTTTNPQASQPVPSTTLQTHQQHVPFNATNHSNPNISTIDCPDVHTACQVHGPSNIEAHPHIPTQAIYPQLSDMIRPQHQINIHAAVPAGVGQPLQQLPVQHHHHQQIVTQPGLYPQLGHHTHAQILPQSHSHQATHLVHGPPAYQTMERKY